MSMDPETLLALARQRQREVARAIAAHRTVAAPAPAINDVTRSWILAVRMTRDYVRARVTGG
jgi:hypothetical protein